MLCGLYGVSQGVPFDDPLRHLQWNLQYIHLCNAQMDILEVPLQMS
jgi:hypothetical protein